MVLNTREIINVVADLSRQENLRICVSECVKGACITGGSTFLGGLVLGPVGMALGGLAGVVLNAARGAQFKPLAEVLLHDLTPAQQALLVNRMNRVIRDLEIQDAITLGTVLLASGSARTQVLRLLTEFVRTDLNLQLM